MYDLGSFFLRLIYFGGSHSAAVFEDIDKRFFATDRKMVNLVNSWDGFVNFDPNPEIFQNFGEKSFNFQIWRQKLKMVCVIIQFENSLQKTGVK